MVGTIDVANYENQLLLEKAQKKIKSALSPSKRVKADADASGLLNGTEMNLLRYISNDFKALLAEGCKVRAQSNINHLQRIMTLSDALKCVKLGTGSYGGHVARIAKAPGPCNGHNTIQPHERAHGSKVTLLDRDKLVGIPANLVNTRTPFERNPDGKALSFAKMTQNLHDYDIDDNIYIEDRYQFVKELKNMHKEENFYPIDKLAQVKTRWKKIRKLIFNPSKFAKYKENYKNKDIYDHDHDLGSNVIDVNTGDRVQLKRMGSKSFVDAHINGAGGERYLEYDEMLELPEPGSSRDVMYSSSYVQGKQKEREAQKIEEEKKEKTRILLIEQEEMALENKHGKRKRKLTKLWRYFYTLLHTTSKSINIKDLQDLSYLSKPSDIICNMICYIGTLLGITSDWNAAKRSIFKETEELSKKSWS